MRGTPTFGRILLMLLAGAGSFFVAWQWSPGSAGESESVVEVLPRESRGTLSLAAATPADTLVRDSTLNLPERGRVAPDSSGNAFNVLDWTPPPPPVVVIPRPPPPPPPAPVAPPLPFTFVGLMEKGVGKPQAFLAQGEVLLVVAAGDMLMNNTYRVDSLSAQQILITYLPLNTQQTLNTSGRTQ